MLPRRLSLWLMLAVLPSCKPLAAPPGGSAPAESLADARRGFVTQLTAHHRVEEPPPKPPTGVFQLIKYPSPIGELSAYVSVPPADHQRHPVIIWVVGGFSNSISEIAWTPGAPENDQSGTAFREAGLAMMYPSFRGGNDNPGYLETFYGEVDDLLAAREYLAAQPFVDPARIYLGGHSTGGTLVLLAAASSKAFRAVFSFGPVDDPAGYGAEVLSYDPKRAKENALRSPVRWLTAIQTPTFVFEGTGGRSNIESLRALERVPHSGTVTFHPIPGATHFSGLQPVSRLIAEKIRKDTEPGVNIAFTPEELARAMK